MAGYVYIKSEYGPDPLWTVGFYRPDEKWEPDSDHSSEDAAAARVRWLNGESHHEPALLEALKALLQQTNNIEVLGEWEALDMNHSMRKKVRAQVDSVIANARAAIAAATGEQA